MAELVDALDSKSCGSNTVRVQVPLRPPDAFLGELHRSESRLKGSLHLKETLFLIVNFEVQVSSMSVLRDYAIQSRKIKLLQQNL